MTDNLLFTQSCERIEKEYKRLGHTLGYRFLLGSSSTLNPETEILFLGLNPGGKRIVPEHPDKSCENGCAFLAEIWGAGNAPGNAPLQVQVQKMFADLAAALPGSRNSKQLLAESLLAYYIPFRSPSISALPNKSESRAFSRCLWTDILAAVTPRLIVTMDKDSFADICAIVSGIRGRQRPHLLRSDVGWGNIGAELAGFEKNNSFEKMSVIRFPHLSRFKIFGRLESKNYTDNLFHKAVQAI